ncbi:hypothetical protein sscle_12g090080 [Sclerotinia sclerotiorum 1980 UF-70]|uniref:J domain-containing protein n=1 Tax=Sclerotinia sclerotiorum (strain ATCC 18683 / 1980 / Ss-1) TaxID=665079 RepID=A0A1D9QH50_SCLS1|nr:hypothetical protein sscle_12g090080 [Sclerotinia sclerotiorum 1980 UF-70]
MFGVNCIPGNVSMFYNLDISPYRPLEEQQQRLRSVMIMIHPDKQNNNNREVILNATSMFQILSPYREILEAEFILERYIKDDREQIQKWDEARTRRMQHRYGGMKPWFFSYNPDPPKWFPNWAVLVDFIHGSVRILPFPSLIDSFWSSKVFRVGGSGKSIQMHMYDGECREVTLGIDLNRWIMPTWTSRDSGMEYTQYWDMVEGRAVDPILKYFWELVFVYYSVILLIIWLLFKLLRCLFFQYVVVGKSKASKSIRNGKALKRRKRRTSRAPYDTPSSENEIDNTVSNQSSQRTLESPECTDFEA